MPPEAITAELFRAGDPSPGTPWLIAALVSVVILAVTLGLMDRVGLFDIPANDTGTKTLAAALALVGAVVSAVVALVGTVVKFSIDDRNSRLAALEANRNYALATEGEKRNRIEAAIRAVDLLGENNKDATKSQIGGAILALLNLGEMELAVSLLAQLWPEGLVTHRVANFVLSRALTGASEEVQENAAMLVYENVDLLSRGELHFWPFRNPRWRTDLPDEVRAILVVAVARWLKADIASSSNIAPAAITILHDALDDPSPFVVQVAAASLRPVCELYDHEMKCDAEDHRTVSIADVAKRLSTVPASTRYAIVGQLEEELREVARARRARG